MHAALGADILAEHQHARIDRQLMLQRAPDGGDHVDALAFGSSASSLDGGGA